MPHGEKFPPDPRTISHRMESILQIRPTNTTSSVQWNTANLEINSSGNPLWVQQPYQECQTLRTSNLPHLAPPWYGFMSLSSEQRPIHRLQFEHPFLITMFLAAILTSIPSSNHNTCMNLQSNLPATCLSKKG